MKNFFLVAALLASGVVFGQQQFQNETVGSLGYFSGQILQLAEATPEDKYSWRPAEGVRSYGEVLAHIVSGNYMFASVLGAKLPDGVNPQTVEQDLKTKSELLAAVKSSSELVSSTIVAISDEDLTTKVTFPFPGDFTKMSASLIALGHSSEHLGQLIAYARMNGITPPWSKGGED